MQELQPIYCSQKSFYGKARVIQNGNSTKLISYRMIVAEIRNGQAKIFGWYSATTTRHIKEFLAQMGFETGTKAEMQKLYC